MSEVGSQLPTFEIAACSHLKGVNVHVYERCRHKDLQGSCLWVFLTFYFVPPLPIQENLTFGPTDIGNTTGRRATSGSILVQLILLWTPFGTNTLDVHYLFLSS